MEEPREPRVEIIIHLKTANNQEESGDVQMAPTVMMLLTGDEGRSLGIAYFSTLENMARDLVDDITITDQTVTVTKGDDRLTIMFDWIKGCSPSKGMKAFSKEFYYSWYPMEFDGFERYCKAGSVDEEFCASQQSHLCGMKSVQGDHCFAEKYNGDICTMNVKVTEMTGIFREKSLITMDTPFKGNQVGYFEGTRMVGFAYPCIYESQ